MELIWTPCSDNSDEAIKQFKKVEENESYITEYTLFRGSAVWVDFYDNQKKWVGYAVIELLESLNIGTVLEDMYDEETFERCKTFIEEELYGGYYLHVFRIFDEYQGKGYGSEAERLIEEYLDCPILLYTVSESESFWYKQGYEILDKYYLYKKNIGTKRLVGKEEKVKSY